MRKCIAFYNINNVAYTHNGPPDADYDGVYGASGQGQCALNR